MNSIFKFILTIFISLLFGTGCNVQLHHGLMESQANEVLILLAKNGISAKKSRDATETEKWIVSVEKEDAAIAMNLMLNNDLPRTKSAGFKELFQKESMLPTSIQEKTKFISALSGELQQTLEEDDSILIARVHINVPIMEKMTKKNSGLSSSAAVFIKMSARSTGNNSISDEAIKLLIANSVGGMTVEDVTVIRSEAAVQELLPGTSSNIGQSENASRFMTSRRILYFVAGVFLFFGVTILGLTIVKSYGCKSVQRQEV